MDPLKFWYDGIGQYLHDAVPNGADPAIVALSRNHPHRTTVGSKIRLGGGKAMSLVTADGSILMADIKPARQPAASTKFYGGEWRTLFNWLASIFINPPEPPFMIVIHGREWDTIHKWRINHSQDVISLSGKETMSANRELVSKLYVALDGIHPMYWQSAARALERRKRSQGSATAIDAEIDAILSKCPALDAVLDNIPPVGSDDFEMLSMLCGDREKNGA